MSPLKWKFLEMEISGNFYVAVHLNLRSVITGLEAGTERLLWNSAWEKQNGGYKCALIVGNC